MASPLTLSKLLATMLRAVVAMSSAEMLLNAMTERGALFGAWHFPPFSETAAAVV